MDREMEAGPTAISRKQSCGVHEIIRGRTRDAAADVGTALVFAATDEDARRRAHRAARAHGGISARVARIEVEDLGHPISADQARLVGLSGSDRARDVSRS